MLTPLLKGMIMPPPVMPILPSTSSASGKVSQALQQSLYNAYPHSVSNPSPARMKLVVLHPTNSWISYLLDLMDSKLSPQRQIVVQDYITGEIIFQISVGDLCALLFDLDKSSSTYTTKLTAALKSLGRIDRLEFYDMSTLYATGMSYNHPTGDSISFSYLMVQLSSKLVVLNVKQGPYSMSLDISLRRQANPNSRKAYFQPIVAQIGEANLKVPPSTMAVPISPTIVLIGCSDGMLRAYDWTLEKVLKTFKVPSNKTDPMWYLLPTNPYPIASNAATPNQATPTASTMSSETLRVVSISNKACAYLWEFEFDSDGSLGDLRPVSRMDGVFASSSSSQDSQKSSPGSSNSPGTVTSTGATAAGEHPWDHTYVDFDAHRELLFWFIPSGYKNSTRPHVFIWDLKLSNPQRKKKVSVGKEDPYMISFASLEVPSVTMVAGWLHPDFNTETLLCALVSQSGDLSLQLINMETDAIRGKVVKAIPWFNCSIAAVVQKGIGSIAPPVIKVSKLLTHRRLDTTSLLLSCNMGLVQIALTDDFVGARHAHLSSHLFGSDLGKAAITVHHSDVQWQSIDIDDKGRVVLNQTQVIYKSPWPLEVPSSRRAVRLPPRFYTSPSGKFLGLFWAEEKRYEILHIASSLHKKSSDSYAPSVDKGNNVLDIAWVGDDDIFALLHPPLESRDDPGSQTQQSPTDAMTSGSISVGSAAVKTFRKNFKIGRGSVGSAGTDKTDKSISVGTISEDISYASSKTSGTRFLPRVELKALIGVTANAAELGSIAAATARSLGDITLRGGNRHIPTDLFSGPNLCVGSQDDGPDGGAAHFYTLKQGATEITASNFVQAGPTLPCPDFVQWDEDGILCALVVQGLVAIYLSRDGEFVLLGNVDLGAPRERNVTVTGLKFVHGVLYCTTRTTVQCIVLGDLSSNGICHLDTFVLSSADGPSLVPKSSISPPTIPLTLNHPAVLGYQSGGLLISTVTGLMSIPLDHPILRISTLLAAGQQARAIRWFDAIPETDHETLAYFLDRRGAADLAVTHLTGLSLETRVDLCLQYGLTDPLAELIQTYGVQGLQGIDAGRGISVGILGPEEHGHSMVVSVSAYLLGQGRTDLVQMMAQQCLESNRDGGTMEAFLLAGLLLAVDPTEPRKILQASVGEKLEAPTYDVALDAEPILANDYAVPVLVRDHIL